MKESSQYISFITVLFMQALYMVSPSFAVQNETSVSIPTSSTTADQRAQLFIRINVPHNKNAKEVFICYPYPIKPPPTSAPQPLSIKRKGLKPALIALGYTARSSKGKIFPPGGWRMQYAFNAAARHVGYLPHTIVELYPWVDSMMEYIRPEIVRINYLEKQRYLRYKAIVADFDKNGFEQQNDAVRKGLYAIDVRFYHGGFGFAKLEPGNWWIIGTHKVMGLVYYWHMPITLDNGEKKQIVLNEANALIIQGSW